MSLVVYNSKHIALLLSIELLLPIKKKKSVLVVKILVPSFTILSFYSFCRSRKVDSSERELAVMAAAASIYSTSNFLLSENVCCF